MKKKERNEKKKVEKKKITRKAQRDSDEPTDPGQRTNQQPCPLTNGEAKPTEGRHPSWFFLLFFFVLKPNPVPVPSKDLILLVAWGFFSSTLDEEKKKKKRREEKRREKTKGVLGGFVLRGLVVCVKRERERE